MIDLNLITFVEFKQNIFRRDKYLFKSNKFLLKIKKFLHSYMVNDIICSKFFYLKKFYWS